MLLLERRLYHGDCHRFRGVHFVTKFTIRSRAFQSRIPMAWVWIPRGGNFSTVAFAQDQEREETKQHTIDTYHHEILSSRLSCDFGRFIGIVRSDSR